MLVYTENGTFVPAQVKVENGRFTEIRSTDYMPDVYMIPGLIDLHFHGCVGADFSDGDVVGLEKMAAYEASVGVTSICPASMSIGLEDLRQAMKAADEFAKNQKKGASFVGINMEGPFINPEKKGAQAEKNMIPCDISLYQELQQLSGGRIKLIDLAPEMAGAMGFIGQVKDEVVVSIAHTMADYDIAMEAFRAGASHVTHLYNAMPSFTHRAPGVIGAARDMGARVELICDGVHVHPSVIRSTFEMFGRDSVIMISDSMRACGLADGSYTLGGQEVMVRGKLATLADGTIAGSVTNLMDCLRYCVKEAGIPLELALQAATINPAKELGIFDETGSITVGKRADYVILDQNLEVKQVCIEGRSMLFSCEKELTRPI